MRIVLFNSLVRVFSDTSRDFLGADVAIKGGYLEIHPSSNDLRIRSKDHCRPEVFLYLCIFHVRMYAHGYGQ